MYSDFSAIGSLLVVHIICAKIIYNIILYILKVRNPLCPETDSQKDLHFQLTENVSGYRIHFRVAGTFVFVQIICSSYIITSKVPHFQTIERQLQLFNPAQWIHIIE